RKCRAFQLFVRDQDVVLGPVAAGTEDREADAAAVDVERALPAASRAFLRVFLLFHHRRLPGELAFDEGRPLAAGGRGPPLVLGLQRLPERDGFRGRRRFAAGQDARSAADQVRGFLDRPAFHVAVQSAVLAAEDDPRSVAIGQLPRLSLALLPG